LAPTGVIFKRKRTKHNRKRTAKNR